MPATKNINDKNIIIYIIFASISKTYMISNKNVFKITYPIFLTLIAQNIVNVTNTAFLGRVGEVEMGASAIGGVFYIAIYMLGFGFSQGAQILIGRRNGERNYHKIGNIFNNGLLFNILLSILIFLLAKLTMPWLMIQFVNSQNVYNASMEYLNWRLFGFFFSFINVMFRAFYVGITKTKVLTISAIITAGTNTLFDYLMIFGNWGFPEMGIAGAGIASVFAELATTLFLVLYTFLVTDIKLYNLFRLKKMEIGIVKQILDLSIFIMFQYFISISTWFLFFIFIEKMGERPLAVTNVGRSLYTLLMMPGSALATAVNTLVSNLIGAGLKDQVLPFLNRMIRVVLILVIPIMAITFSFPRLFAMVYTNNLELIEACIPIIRVVSVVMIACAVSSIIFNALSGTGNTRTAFFIEFLTLFLYVAYIYYTAMVNPTTVAVVWLSEFVYWLPIGIISYLYLLKGNWQKKQI